MTQTSRSIAREVSLDDSVSMSTATKANSIGGERCASIRDVQSLQLPIRQFRQLQVQALKLHDPRCAALTNC